MADDKFQRFGKYLILDHLVDGGMAKICRARFLGEQANKIVAIKMVQAQYSKDPSFVQMFEDELKVLLIYFTQILLKFMTMVLLMNNSIVLWSILMVQI